VSKFFIERRSFAWVIAIVLMMAGASPSYLAGRAVPEHRAARRPSP